MGPRHGAWSPFHSIRDGIILMQGHNMIHASNRRMKRVKKSLIGLCLMLAPLAQADWDTRQNTQYSEYVNVLSQSCFIDSAGSVTGRDNPQSTSNRVGVVDLRRTTGSTSSPISVSSLTATYVIDSTTPIRGLLVQAVPKSATQFDPIFGGYALVSISQYGGSLLGVRQSGIYVRPDRPLFLDNIYWYNTAGLSVTLWMESSSQTNTGFNMVVTVIR